MGSFTDINSVFHSPVSLNQSVKLFLLRRSRLIRSIIILSTKKYSDIARIVLMENAHTVDYSTHEQIVTKLKSTPAEPTIIVFIQPGITSCTSINQRGNCFKRNVDNMYKIGKSEIEKVHLLELL
ncbi:hypothetical protein C1I59_02795 [Paenibacillus polymyxa]|nr:hypothetical protein C1I59_02795 [Paenibacillus polymyxa]